MSNYTTNKRYCPHEITTKLYSVQTYRQTGDSNSIVNQKKHLESYCRQKGYTNLVHYTDDGWSGGNFERPAWKRLIADIEAGIGTLCRIGASDQG